MNRLGPAIRQPAEVERGRHRGWVGWAAKLGATALALTTAFAAAGCAAQGEKSNGDVGFAPSYVFIHRSGVIASVTEVDGLPDGKLGQQRVGLQVATVSPGGYRVVSPYQLTAGDPIQFGCINPDYAHADDLLLSIEERNGTYGHNDFGYATALTGVEGVVCYDNQTNVAWISSSGPGALAGPVTQVAATLAS